MPAGTGYGDARRGALLGLPTDYASPASRPLQSVVTRGDTLFGIARRHALTVNQLAATSPGLGHAALRPGQTLVVRQR